MDILGYGADSVSVAVEDVAPDRWKDDVYVPDILGRPDTIFKKPGYEM
jgi:4-oxalocrotonate tautomerase